MADPHVTANGPGIKKKKENRKEQQREKIEVSLRPPGQIIEFEFSQDFPNAKYVTWASGEFVEASCLDNEVLKTAYYDDDNNLV
jgi:hypothetical protein